MKKSKNFANKIIKSKISFDSKSFALPNNTKSSVSFIFIIFMHIISLLLFLPSHLTEC